MLFVTVLVVSLGPDLMFCNTTTDDIRLNMMTEAPVMINTTKSIVKASTPTVLPVTAQQHTHRRSSKKDQVSYTLINYGCHFTLHLFVRESRVNEISLKNDCFFKIF